MSDARRRFSDREAFLAAARQAGIATIVLAYRAEWGPADPETVGIAYGRQDEIRLLAYHDGTIYSCDLAGEALTALERTLQEAGFATERRCRNLATFGSGS